MIGQVISFITIGILTSTKQILRYAMEIKPLPSVQLKITKDYPIMTKAQIREEWEHILIASACGDDDSAGTQTGGQVTIAEGTTLDLDACPDDWDSSEGVTDTEIRMDQLL